MKRWGALFLLVGLMGILTGCFQFTPLTPQPQLLYSEDFSNASTPSWVQGVDPPGTWQITNGRYYGMLDDYDSYYYVYSGAISGLTDFRIQATTSQQGTATDHSWGLILRASNERFYAFEISADGWYVFSVYTPSDWEDLYDWHTTNLIRPAGQTNTLRVDVRGNTFDLYLNGQWLAKVTDPASTLTSGSVGFIIETWNDSNGGAWFDDLEVWSLVD